MFPPTLKPGACRVASALATTLAIVVSALPAFAAPATGTRARQLAVSVPSETATLAPGTTGTVPIRVINPGSTAVTVRITGHGVRFGDDGHVTIAGADTRWAGRVDFPTRPVTVAAQSYREIGLKVRTPAHISPDLYFIGFVVTPQSNRAANLTYVNQIGSYITIDVPGPRSRLLAADLHLPGFALTTTVDATLHIHNVGKAAAVYWGENDTSATPGSSSPRQQRIDGSLLPIGRSRAIAVTAKPSFLFSTVTIRIHIFYPGRTEASTREITLTKQVLVIQPAALVLLGGILVIGCILYTTRRRKRRRPLNRATTRRVDPRPEVRSRRRAPANVAAAIRVDRLLAHTRDQWDSGM